MILWMKSVRLGTPHKAKKNNWFMIMIVFGFKARVLKTPGVIYGISVTCPGLYIFSLCDPSSVMDFTCLALILDCFMTDLSTYLGSLSAVA